MMNNHQDRISKVFTFILYNGREVFPVKMKRRGTGNIAFRVSPGGTGGNVLEVCEEVNEKEMVRKVFDEGYAVRCQSLDRQVRGLYKIGHRSVKEVRRELPYQTASASEHE
ncbi:hypothetical protein [Halomonas sp. 3H]|uniref:hypothetical protein n=1 Tax=Halomonas sp. 3H TaxID=2952527 RepID=UPI0020B6F4FB|nr:hypothetical protein [Halomonas sp. 3H]